MKFRTHKLGDAARLKWKDPAGIAHNKNVRDDSGNYRPLSPWVTPRRCASTATVSGVAAFSGDPKSLYLKPGDIVNAKLEKIGVLGIQSYLTKDQCGKSVTHNRSSRSVAVAATEPMAVDLLLAEVRQDFFSEQSAGSSRSSPQSSSDDVRTTSRRYSSNRPMHCAGVAAIAHHFSSTASVNPRGRGFAASRSIASAIGRSLRTKDRRIPEAVR